MTPWTENQTVHWEKIRQKGKTRFVLIRGVLGWGFLTGLMVFLVTALFMKTRPFSLESGLAGMIPYLCAGVLWGILMWNRSEAGYKVHLSGKELEDIRQESSVSKKLAEKSLSS